MPNEIRPWNPWGDKDFVYDGATLSLFGFESIIFNEVGRREAQGLNVKKDALFREAVQSLNEALDEPVLATEKVLAGLPKDAKAFVLFKGSYQTVPYNLYWGKHRYTFGGDEVWYFDEFSTNFKDCYIKPNDPKTAEYLRNFYRNGVRIKEGG